MKEAYPGDDYVDIVSLDVYLAEYEKTDYRKEYERLIRTTSVNKPAALTEIGCLPDIQLLEQSRIPWAYYMTWSKDFCLGERFNSVESLKAMYNSVYSRCANDFSIT